MKRNLQALALAAILCGTQVPTNDAFAAEPDEIQSVPAMETYADRHAADRANSPSTSPFPLGSGEYDAISAKETYVDRHRNDAVKASGSPFPAGTGSTTSD